MPTLPLVEKVNARCFAFVHGRNLVYNTCWEDPQLDREALDLKSNDTLLVITSAGCNALDYALLAPRHVYAVDLNPRQNALLELKIAGLKHLDYGEFFSLFGRGRWTDVGDAYHDVLRDCLSPTAQRYWDRHLGFFSGRGWRRSFYFRGTAGTFARAVNFYIDRVAKVRDDVTAVLDAESIDEQRAIYDCRLRKAFWGQYLRWAMGRDSTLSLLGVPRPQRQQVERHYRGGIARFIEDGVETVFTRLPLADNYFWRVYLSGEYSPACCPEYLKRHNFESLKAGLVNRISVHTTSVAGFLQRHHTPISRFVLLDHMDWLSSAGLSLLQEEWQAIVDRATPAARVLWRSGGLRTDFVDDLQVTVAGRPSRVGNLLGYHPEQAAALHARDRVHTYGSFYIADLAA